MLNELFLLRMKDYLGDDFNRFLESYSKDNIRSFTINNNYISNEEFEKIFDLNIKKIPYIHNGYYLVDKDVKLGFHPLHHAGAFYMQDPSAMCVVESIDIPSNFMVLDLCAAPGGKSIQLAQKVKDGLVISNEIDFKRSKILYSNVERMGLSNVVVTNNSPKDFLKDFENCFDLILIDAPCSGEGMFRKYPESQELWSLDNVNVCHERDIEIVDIAHKLLKKDGILIYSTCTFAKEENEDIISYILEKYNYSQIDIKDELKDVLKEGFIPKTYRFYPHLMDGEGQFLAVLKKTEGEISSFKKNTKYIKSNELIDFCKKNLNVNIERVIQKNNYLYYTPFDLYLNNLNVLNYGVKLGEIYNKRFIPDHNLFKSLSNVFDNQVNLDFNDNLVSKYLRGEQINFECQNGFGVIKINHIPLGGYKANSNNLNNYYPKGLRNF